MLDPVLRPLRRRRDGRGDLGRDLQGRARPTSPRRNTWSTPGAVPGRTGGGLLERSPIYHAKEARTPLLILHGKDDPRVFPGQSLELFRFLKIRGRAPVRLVLYPGEGHGNLRAASRYDYQLRSLAWLEHYLKGPGGPPPPVDVDYEGAKPGSEARP